MPIKHKICLIVDNPLRDLDGLILVAWHLARSNADVWLVPMYEQGFDVPTIKPDLVLLNYIRPNNLNHALNYISRGIKVGVLDTEGMAGKSPEDFAVIIARSGAAQWMNLYCIWGQGQLNALSERKVMPDDIMKLTGCPRYDYCSTPWREQLPRPYAEPGYVLINTNFPGVNPRFVQNSAKESKAMMSGGFTEEAVTNYMRDAGATLNEMITFIGRLVTKFPEQRFVLRPHPFESTLPYESAISAKNFTVRQEGTSIEWLNHAAALIQLNCLTTIEAAAFGTPALSPAWLNKPTLHVPLSSELSINLEDEQALCDRLAVALRASTDSQLEQNIKGSPSISTYLLNDGHAAARVSQAILDSLRNSYASESRPIPSVKFRAVQAIRTAIGAPIYHTLQGMISARDLRNRKKSKLFTATYVESVITRIEQSAATQSGISVQKMPITHKTCGHSVRLTIP